MNSDKQAKQEKSEAEIQKRKQDEETLKRAMTIFAAIGAVAGIIAAFTVAGETWGWLCLLLLAPVGAAIGCFCGFLFGGGLNLNIKWN